MRKLLYLNIALVIIWLLMFLGVVLATPTLLFLSMGMSGAHSLYINLSLIFFILGVLTSLCLLKIYLPADASEMQKQRIPTVVIGIISCVVFLASAGYYAHVFYPGFAMFHNLPYDSNDPDWQTYRGDLFSIQYPQDWKAEYIPSSSASIFPDPPGKMIGTLHLVKNAQGPTGALLTQNIRTSGSVEIKLYETRAATFEEWLPHSTAFGNVAEYPGWLGIYHAKGMCTINSHNEATDLRIYFLDKSIGAIISGGDLSEYPWKGIAETFKFHLQKHLP